MDKLRVALRSLLRVPGFTAAGVLVLAIGIGGSTAVFSVLRGVVLRPLGFRAPEQLVRVYERPAGIDASWSFSGPDFLDLAAESSAFQSTAGIRPVPQTLTGHGPPVQVRIARVSASFFSTLHARLPLATRMLLGTSHWMGTWWWAVVLGGIFRHRPLRRLIERMHQVRIDGHDHARPAGFCI